MAHVVGCVSSNSATQQQIIRKAARVADTYHARLTALYVQTTREAADHIPPLHPAPFVEPSATCGGAWRTGEPSGFRQHHTNHCRLLP